MDEVVELRRMFGLPDCLMRVCVADTSAYENWLTTHLLGDPPSPASTPASPRKSRNRTRSRPDATGTKTTETPGPLAVY
jgi:hypothetical protein